MKLPDDLRTARARFACSICPRNSASRVALAIASVLLALGATQLSAQQPPEPQSPDPPSAEPSADQYWPPDDSDGVQPRPIPSYTPSQQYGYSQPQYQQSYPQQPYANPADTYPQQSYSPTQQPLSPNDLTQLVAPIALYPDALVAQILAASTYPAQVAAADQWRRSMGNAPAEQIAAGADAQTSWDPSIKALTAFPQVLAMMAGNLQWTTSLGNAYYNQPQDVLQTIQVMRQRAEEAGNLQSTPQEEITNDQGYIDIAPANPQVVYVPTYNPWAVYGQPVSPYPGFSFIDTLGSFFGSSPVQYGLSFAMSAFMGTPWGWLGWSLDWLTHSVLFNHNDYCTQSASVRDWGFPHGGPRAYPGNPQWIHGDRNAWSRNGYNRAYPQPGNGFNRGVERPIGHPIQHWGDARTTEGFNRGFPSRNGTPMRPTPPHQQAFLGREQQLNRQGNGGPYGQPHDNYISRPGMAYAGPGSPSTGLGRWGGGPGSQPYRAPQNNYQRSYNGRSYESYGGSQTWSQPRSGGFHPFGGGRNPGGFGGNSPKNYSFNGGGHSGWGGSGGWKAPKAPSAPHFGGGGHSFGGGGHSFGGGGGHSFGGGHSGGGGHGHHR